VSLDVHAETSQLCVQDEGGQVLLEMQVATRAEELRRVIGGIPGPKSVVFEEGPMSGMISDAVRDLVDEVISCEPSHNALIARAEDSNDERDARRLGQLARLRAVRPVYVPQEPCRGLRSLLVYDLGLAGQVAEVRNKIKGLCRRNGIPCAGARTYGDRGRARVLAELSPAAMGWQMESLYRLLDALEAERRSTSKRINSLAKKAGPVERLCTIPGVGPVVARTLVGWIAEPQRFRSRSALCSYAGLGLGQGWTNWQPVGPARASRRGNRCVKRALFLAARAAIRGRNALARRYQARRQEGWEDRKAIRDVARVILKTAVGLWRKGTAYDDAAVSVPRASTPEGVGMPTQKAAQGRRIEGGRPRR
jgi:transposase